MKKSFLIFCFLIPIINAEPIEFVQVQEDEEKKEARLQTANTVYTRGGEKVTLLSAVHVADRAYYEALNKEFQNYDRLLFEMIGGDQMDRDRASDDDLGALAKTYQKAANFLELTDQLSVIDYSPEHFVHADLTIAEFRKLQKKRKETLFTFLLKNSFASTPKHQPNPFRILKGLITGEADPIKLELLETLGEADNQIQKLAGESVIITDRNQKCLNVLKRELAAGHRNLGIFYGAAHFPDLDKRLIEMGFTRGPQTWFDAWVVKK